MGTDRYTPRSFDDLSPDKRPSFRQALIPVLGLVAFLGIGSAWLKLDPHIPLIWSIALVGLLGRFVWGYTWEDLYEGIERSLSMGLQALLILFTIYGVVSTWVAAGTIPTLMYYGLDLLSPQVFLPATAILVGITTFAIGSSWTAVGTLGVAFIGIGSGLGVPAPMTAGAILTGAYAGDKQSPLSDTTNLAAAVTNTDLYDHIHAMRTGTFVAFGLSIVGFVVLSLGISGTIPAGQIAEIQTALASTYNISLLAFLPLAVTFGLAAAGYPALTVLLAGAFAGAFTSILVQGASFVTAWQTFMSGTGPETGSELVNSLLASGGVSGSAWTIAIVVAALTLGGLLEQTGILAVLAHRLERGVRSTGSLVAATGISAILTNALTAQQYMSIVVPGMTLRNTYDEFGLDSSDLSQAIESAGTPTGALLPWHAGGAYMSGVLGVATFSYAPYYLFGYLSPLVLFAFILAGVGFAGNATKTSDPSVSPADD
ncbi:Na+/H+ antiporter NhaC [Haloferax mediterranei ATCC 33500]|uniref:Arginine:ornithine antiporter n=1 Tax=Haloferax mediterranei (strain ATCC 33500 / DSM 1411 / JCM 8866 / NBRC 14739 / NCIMB 2177 / R-4) TaxID=523841 RepID=I3R423_HALMT|nr:Na+/H+ antiporter NhaC [Haloferax mediterranei]AFK18983.1 Na+/H+ antiporter [Haloferax mediterranei ATCC 33500]AHZ21657.1 arginine:ornithine antiporter [Haloferax mediterranei ATCC 33500]EMA03159.1 Na+/H+ antiporter [Haloferax mediterranei ATCC 33500]MDX5989074.1 Na+/H+ antiporter NhaC [Haloferax mediterranei ATCC 33500]QCQ75463.1 Na+/H+ antiporter NhaC [Haloferax mediterranei ATCC 33500]